MLLPLCPLPLRPLPILRCIQMLMHGSTVMPGALLLGRRAQMQAWKHLFNMETSSRQQDETSYASMHAQRLLD